jgi:hypothetical protein
MLKLWVHRSEEEKRRGEGLAISDDVIKGKIKEG